MSESPEGAGELEPGNLDPAALARSCGLDEASSDDAAAALARLCGHEVESLEGRDEWSTLTALPDGTMQMTTSTSAVRTEVNGEWEPVDPTIELVGGELRAAAPVVPMAFSNGGDGPLARIGAPGEEMVIGSPMALPEPVVEGPRLTYEQVLPGVDLIVTVDESGAGFSQVFRVESAEAARQPELAELVLPVDHPEGMSLSAEDGHLQYVDESGDVVLEAPPAVMWDSSGDELALERLALTADLHPSLAAEIAKSTPSTHAVVHPLQAAQERAVAPVVGDVVEPVEVELRGGELALTPDASMVTDAETVWPVYVDPKFEREAHQWVAIRNVLPSKWKFAVDEGVGLCDRARTTSCSHTVKSRLIYEFNELVAFPKIPKSSIVGATFVAKGTHSYSCTPKPVVAYRVTNPTTSTTWDSSTPWASADKQDTQTVAHRAGCSSGSRVRDISFDVIGAAKWAAGEDKKSLSIGLRAQDETSMDGWKRYAKEAFLTVVFNRPPTKPSGIQMSWSGSGIKACTGSVQYVGPEGLQFSALFLDPDDGADGRTKVHPRFRIFQGSTRVWGSDWREAVTSGTRYSVGGTGDDKITLRDGNYELRVDAKDATGPEIGISEIATCLFSIDVTPPPAPTITPIEPIPSGTLGANGLHVTYPANKASGGVGQRGAFWMSIGPPPSPGNFVYQEPVTYRFAFNSDSLAPLHAAPPKGVTVPAFVRPPEIQFAPDRPGSYYIVAQAVDPAGNVSERTTYRFIVNFATKIGTWQLDAGAGSSSAGTLDAPALAISSSTQWVNGAMHELVAGASSVPGFRDRALRFDSAGDTASAQRPLLDVKKPFTVSAFVKLDSSSRTGVALSQRGWAGLGLALGFRKDSSCPTGTGGCWAFWMDRADTASSTSVVAMSSAAVTTGSWVHLTGVRDADGRVSVYVCEVGKPGAAVRSPEPSAATSSSSLSSPWVAGGPFEVGGADVRPDWRWPGSIDRVEVWAGARSITETRRACVPSLHQYEEGH